MVYAHMSHRQRTCCIRLPWCNQWIVGLGLPPASQSSIIFSPAAAWTLDSSASILPLKNSLSVATDVCMTTTRTTKVATVGLRVFAVTVISQCVPNVIATHLATDWVGDKRRLFQFINAAVAARISCWAPLHSPTQDSCRAACAGALSNAMTVFIAINWIRPKATKVALTNRIRERLVSGLHV